MKEGSHRRSEMALDFVFDFKYSAQVKQSWWQKWVCLSTPPVQVADDQPDACWEL